MAFVDEKSAEARSTKARRKGARPKSMQRVGKNGSDFSTQSVNVVGMNEGQFSRVSESACTQVFDDAKSARPLALRSLNSKVSSSLQRGAKDTG